MSYLFSMIKDLRYIDLNFFKRKKLIDIIRESWGQEITKDRKFDLISIYHKLKSKQESHTFVDDTTWEDLNMDLIFSKMDRNVSAIGSQYLYHLLHVYEKDLSLLTDRIRLYKYFTENEDIREKILVKLYKLHHNNAYFIPNIILKETPRRPKLYLLIYLLSFIALLSTILIFYYPVFFLVSLSLAIINIMVNYFYGRKIYGYFGDLSYLSTMLNVGIRLSEMDGADVAQIDLLRKHKSLAVSLNKKIGWFVIDKSRLDEIAAAIVDYLNYFYLFNIVSFVHSIHHISSNQERLKEIYEAIASLDSTISVASYLKSIPYHCKPKFNDLNVLDVKDIYHPLLQNPVSNSYNLNNKSCLITGSNMAGKTTFIKTIGVNIILGQSISICLASDSNLPRYIVKSSIKREDNINENKSYYYREIESILEFIHSSSSSQSYLFLIDEIYRGTNTIERISAATSVLKFLSRRNMTLVTTHDIELQDLLEGYFEIYHFSEQVENEKHYFDYLIKPGPCSARNAIKLLELKDYPEVIVKEAYDLAKNFHKH